MKSTRRGHHKQPLPNVGFERGGEPPKPTVEFDLDSIDPPEEGEGADPVTLAPDRAEVETRLKELGLSKAQRTVGLAKVFERKSTREIATELKTSKTWVADTWKRILPLLSRAQPAVSVPKPPGENGSKPLPPVPLKEAMRRLSLWVNNYRFEGALDAGHMVAGLAELDPPANAREAERAVAAVALWPRLLAHPKAGPPLAAELAEVMTAARYGSKAERESARETLNGLTRYNHGNRCPIPDAVLGSESLSICVTLAELQRAWRLRSDERPQEQREARMEWIREQFSAAVEGITDKELLPRLQGDLLPSAARFAEQATGIAAESFERAWGKMVEETESLRQLSRP